MGYRVLRRRSAVRATDSRLKATSLRARLNATVVMLNLTWERCWEGEHFQPSERAAAGARNVLGRAQELDGLVASCPLPRHARGRIAAAGHSGDDTGADTAVLQTAMVPTVWLLTIAARELADGVSRGVDLPALRRSDADLEYVLRAHPAARTRYAVACIHARRYVLLAHPRSWPPGLPAGQSDAAWGARSRALTELRLAVGSSAALKTWARTDPAFSHLLDEKEFDWATRPDGVGVSLPYRAPFVLPPTLDQAPTDPQS